MRMVRIYFHTSIFISQWDRDRTLTLLVTLVAESALEFFKKRTRYITSPRYWQELGSRQVLLRARSRPSCCAEHDGCERDGRGHGHLDACYRGATSIVFIVTAHKEVRVSRNSEVLRELWREKVWACVHLKDPHYAACGSFTNKSWIITARSALLLPKLQMLSHQTLRRVVRQRWQALLPT